MSSSLSHHLLSLIGMAFLLQTLINPAAFFNHRILEQIQSLDCYELTKDNYLNEIQCARACAPRAGNEPLFKNYRYVQQTYDLSSWRNMEHGDLIRLDTFLNYLKI